MSMFRQHSAIEIHITATSEQDGGERGGCEQDALDQGIGHHSAESTFTAMLNGRACLNEFSHP
jgi:hypothetical protein